MITPGQAERARIWTALPAALIVLAAIWVYGPALHGTWLWDDGLEIARNPQLADAGGWWKAWVYPRGLDYLPLKDTVLWIEAHLWADSVFGYHLVNLGLHLTSALLLWRLLGRLGVRHAWIGGLLFAVHPAAVESVAWMSEFKNTLSLPPLLLAVGAYLDYEESGQARDYWEALGWFLAAMLCKSSVVMLPAGLLLIAWWRRGRLEAADLRATGPFFAVALGLGLVTLKFQLDRAIRFPGPMPDLAARIAQAGWSAAAYLKEGLFPVGLMPIYPAIRSALPAATPWAGFAALLWLCWWKRESWGRHALLGLGWFLIHLLPVLGLLPLAYLRVAPRADHLAYLPLTGLVALAAAGFGAAVDALGREARFRPARWAAWAGAAAVIAALAVSSRAYAGVFRDDEALWTCALARNPQAWLAANNLGRIYLTKDRPLEAADKLEAAVRFGPPSAEVHANLGNAYARLGRVAEARAQFEEATGIDPGFAGAHYDFGLVLLAAGDAMRARDQFRAALLADPDYAAAHNNLGLALARLGQLPEAVAEYERALRLNPGLPEAHLNLGNALFRQGRVPEAADQYRAALAIAPGYAPAHQNLGSALERLGRPRDAEAEFSAARSAAH